MTRFHLSLGLCVIAICLSVFAHLYFQAQYMLDATTRVETNDTSLEDMFKAAYPLFSTIDHRPATIRRQMAFDSKHQNGELLGCALQLIQWSHF